MNMNVTFEHADMSFAPKFSNVVQVGTSGGGTVFYPAVSVDGVISWTNNGGLQNPEPVNIKGKDGATPVKGVDYYTDADKKAMVNDVIAALPVYKGEVVV